MTSKSAEPFQSSPSASSYYEEVFNMPATDPNTVDMVDALIDAWNNSPSEVQRRFFCFLWARMVQSSDFRREIEEIVFDWNEQERVEFEEASGDAGPPLAFYRI